MPNSPHDPVAPAAQPSRCGGASAQPVDPRADVLAAVSDEDVEAVAMEGEHP